MNTICRVEPETQEFNNDGHQQEEVEDDDEEEGRETMAQGPDCHRSGEHPSISTQSRFDSSVRCSHGVDRSDQSSSSSSSSRERAAVLWASWNASLQPAEPLDCLIMGFGPRGDIFTTACDPTTRRPTGSTALHSVAPPQPLDRLVVGFGPRGEVHTIPCDLMTRRPLRGTKQLHL